MTHVTEEEMRAAAQTALQQCERRFAGNAVLAELIDNETAEEAPDYRPACDECGQLSDAGFLDDHNDHCPVCYPKFWFLCRECGDETSRDDEHASHPGLCESCGQECEEERCEEVKEEIRDILEGIEDLSVLRKVLQAVKRVTK